MFNKALEHVIGACYRRARTFRQESMTVEDLLLSLLDDTEIVSAIESLNGDVPKLQSELIQFIADTSNALPPHEDADTAPTESFQRVLQRAVYHVQSSGLSEVTPLRTLVALYGEKDSHAVKLLHDQEIRRLDVINYVSHGIQKISPPSSIERIERIQKPSSLHKSNKSPLRLFISYAHTDLHCLERLLIHLRPLERRSKIEAWSDRRILPGGKWRNEIAENINDAAVAVLLVSADFLASEFIASQELPPLLIKAEATGTRIIPVILKPCGFVRDESLQNFQCINDPKQPLLGLSEIEQERLYDRIAEEVHNELKQREAE
ncbi:MAG TPA: TIR domain-containing protein [Rhodanobacteraceae bacterium]|nr:TIR domain-containing protein [Rhodanobacteraceae bacterium]